MNPNQKHHINSENSYVDELKKCIGKIVQVVKDDGQVFRGICKAICFTHLNIVLMTDTHKIIVKNISYVVRERDSVTNQSHDISHKILTLPSSVLSNPITLKEASDNSDIMKEDSKITSKAKLGRPKK